MVVKQKKGPESLCCLLRLFYARHHLPFAAHWSDTEPGMEARSKTAPASPLLPLRHCHGFSFRWVLNALRARLAASPNCEASSKRQGDGQRFQKKSYENNKSKRSVSTGECPAIGIKKR
jgi:hypothetical protein